MSKETINKEKLLNVALDIVVQEGVAALNIRKIAQKANVAIGSVYNYFESKDTLFRELTQQYWEHNFLAIIKRDRDLSDFRLLMRESYDLLSQSLPVFRDLYFGYNETQAKAKPTKPNVALKDQLSDLYAVFKTSLNCDPCINPTVWTDNFTQEQFIHHIIWTMLGSIIHEGVSFDYTLELVNHLLYPETMKESHHDIL